MSKIRSLVWLLRRCDRYALYKLDLFRYLVCRIRKFYFIKIKKNLKVWKGADEHLFSFEDGKKTIQYNLQGLHDVSCARSLRLIKPLSTIETLRSLEEAAVNGGTLSDLNYACNSLVLSIGPRTEGEIFCLIAYGFKPKNIKALDLISYSPYIEVGDMHEMPYQDAHFDVVLASCVLAYSLDPQRACNEILRVVKNGGLICFSHDVNYRTHKKYPIKSCDDYLKFFGSHVKNVFYKHELPEQISDKSGSYTCSVIFQITKSPVMNSLTA